MLEDQASRPEQQLADWETLASLTGYTTEVPKASPPVPEHAISPSVAELKEDSNEPKAVSEGEAKTAPAGESIDEADDLLDPEDLDEQAQTKAQLWTNPLAKGAFVAALVGVGVGGLGLFLHSIQGVKPSLQAKIQPPQTPQDTNPPVDQKQEEIAKLKTVNALGTQAQALKQNQAVANVKTLPTKSANKSKVPQANRTVDRSSVNTSRSLPSTPVVPTEYASITRSPLPAVRPAATFAPAAPVSQAAAFSQQRQPQFDPQTAWQAALNTGSYGQTNDEQSGSVTTTNETAPATLVASRTISSAQESSSVQEKALKPETQLETRSEVQLSNVSNDRYERDAAAILSEEQSSYSTVTTGITASATLVTSIVWAQDLKIDPQSQRFVIQLDRPMVSDDGKIVLEQGTRLIAQVQSTSDSGAVQLSIVSIVKTTPDGEQTIDIPRNAISVSAEDGRPLVADRQSRGRQAGVNFGTVLSGALSQVGTALSQPQSQSITASPYSSTTVTNGGRSVVGSVLQGTFGSVSQQLQQRNQQVQPTQQQDFWVIPAGRHLQLTVTNSFGVEV